MLERRFLPLLTEGGDYLIPRPDYMVLSALAHSDAISMRQTYEVMLREDQLRPPSKPLFMSETGKLIKSRIIEARVTGRVMSGEVILELVRLAEAKGAPPILKQACKLVALNHQAYIEKKSSFLSVLRNVEKQFSRYRSISHLWAVAAYKPSLVHELEGETLPLQEFLGLARALEIFVDNNVVTPGFKWNPFRVPHQFPPIWKIDLPPLEEAELEKLARQDA